MLTFGGLIGDQLLGGDDGTDGSSGGDDAATESATPAADAVGVGDELLPETQPIETVKTSEIRGESPGSRTYILRVVVENPTDEDIELRLTGVSLRDESSLDSVSTSGAIAAGETGEVTGAWDLPTDSMPVAVDAVLRRGGEDVVARSVTLKRPPIRG
ncbi:hypothetical protein ACFQFD_01390 [Halobaculum halobium]|uniref:Uncharacterized protein n=1 Tax=Halobaculum halobium TaxID=3032281 RepID=A0ABD5T9G1_9EURY